MRYMVLILLLALTVGTSQAHEGTKIGVVDADRVIQKSNKGKSFFDEYENRIKAKQDEIKAQVDEFTNAQKDYQAKAASLSEDKAIELRTRLERMKTDLERSQQDAKREMDGILEGKLDEFRKALVPLIRQVAQEKNLDMVVNFTPQSNIVHVSENIDITDDVIKKFDAQ